MGVDMKLFNYKNIDNDVLMRLPKVMQDQSLYTGKYAAANEKNSSKRRNAAGAGTLIAKCGCLTTDFAEALCRAAMLESNPNTGDGYGMRLENRKMVSFVAEICFPSTDLLYGEHAFSGHRVNVAYTTKFAISDPIGESTAPYLFCLWSLFMQDPEFHDAFVEFVDYFKSIDKDGNVEKEGPVKDLVCKLADTAYMILNGGNDKDLVHLKANQNDPGKLEGIIVKASYFVPTQYIGTLKTFQTSSATNLSKLSLQDDFNKITSDDGLIGYFSIDTSRVLSEQEKKLLVQPKHHTPSKEAISICKMIQASGHMHPIRNILLRGESGFGKTETARHIAMGLGLPYTFITCSSETEIYDLLGQMMPNEDRNSQDHVSLTELADLEGLPDVETISIDPETSYTAITGTYKEGATSKDCLVALINRVSKNPEVHGGYHYVESQLVQSIRNGWVCELQEPSVITRPGALVGLNGLLDESNAVALPSGEVLRRHPHSVIVATTNLDYEGCRAMNQSFLSRFQIKIDLKAPSKSVFEQRIRAMTNCPKDVDIKGMLNAYEAIKRFLTEHYLTDGSVDMRTIADWVTAYSILHNYVEAAEMTVIPSSTTDPEGIKEVRNIVMKNF